MCSYTLYPSAATDRDLTTCKCKKLRQQSHLRSTSGLIADKQADRQPASQSLVADDHRLKGRQTLFTSLLVAHVERWKFAILRYFEPWYSQSQGYPIPEASAAVALEPKLCRVEGGPPPHVRPKKADVGLQLRYSIPPGTSMLLRVKAVGIGHIVASGQSRLQHRRRI